MRSLVLYSALKKAILSKWPKQFITNSFIDYNVDNDLGIYAKDIGPLKSLLNKNKYNGRVATVQFIFQGTQDETDYYTNRTFCSSLENYILSLQNKVLITAANYAVNNAGDIVYDDKPATGHNGIEVLISSTDLVSSIVNIGKSPDGRPLFSINFNITYFIGGNKND